MSLFASAPALGACPPPIDYAPQEAWKSSRQYNGSYRPRRLPNRAPSWGAEGSSFRDVDTIGSAKIRDVPTRKLAGGRDSTGVKSGLLALSSPPSRVAGNGKVSPKDAESIIGSGLFLEYQQRRVTTHQQGTDAVQQVMESQRRIPRRNTHAAAASSTAHRSLRMGVADMTVTGSGHDSRTSTSLPSLGVVRQPRMSRPSQQSRRNKVPPSLGGDDLPAFVGMVKEERASPAVYYTLPEIR
jgi:hypothetical protein